eukprot:TRINITY_DN1826_c0_g2_i1.p1 TRINITY_DN1826_c0_g2~~TRINITY_DN1826_c0_g2_i1.p1  ORF type:complete len:345 (-),score=54.62 TRINITY_DN1826_c0_g2_i1:226-1260(-)
MSSKEAKDVKVRTQEKAASGDQNYLCDKREQDAVQEKKPWNHEMKYFKECKISTLAAMRIFKHAISGVLKGTEKGMKPLEVMGLLMGKIEGRSIVVLDACPLPVEGAETRVTAADDAVAFMSNMVESLAAKRSDRFIGWYHSHPFDVETHSHCFLSATDVYTQQSWQRMSGQWVAIVVDPLRSLAKQQPEFGCFRVFPDNAVNSNKNECPDGSIADSDSRRTRWGPVPDRYYELKLTYFLSSLGLKVLDIMSRNSLWIRVLASSSILEQEYRQRFTQRVQTMTDRLGTHPQTRSSEPKDSESLQAAQASTELAIEQCKGQSSQVLKELVFNNNNVTARPNAAKS